MKLQEEKKQNLHSEEEQKEEDKKKYTLKVVITTVITTLLLIAILLLCVLFGLKNCSNKNYNNQSTSSQTIKDEELNNRFLDIVKKQMIGDGYDEDELTEVVAIMAQDNYPTNFTLDIVAKSSSKLYYYYAENANYKDVTGTYSNMVEYLKLDKSNYLDGDITLTSESISGGTSITTTKQGRWTIGVNAASEYHLSGWYLENNEFHVFYKRILPSLEEDPFTSGVGDFLAKSGDILYDYYLGLAI